MNEGDFNRVVENRQKYEDRLYCQFFSDGVEQRKIHDWCKKHYLLPSSSRRQWINYKLDGKQPEEWERGLFAIFAECHIHAQAQFFCESSQLPERERKRRIDKIINHLEKLNELINFTGAGVFNNLGELFADSHLNGDASKIDAIFLFCAFLDSRYDEIISSFTESAKSLLNDSSPDTRPNTGDPNARILARKLKDFMRENFNATSTPVITACVALTYPNLCPDEEAVRKWLMKN